jgi:outer membrane lipoprotein SlyB
MELTDRVLVVLGFFAGAVVGAMAMLAPLTAVGTGAHGLGAKLLLIVGAAIGAVVGARVNEASARALAAERTAELAA